MGFEDNAGAYCDTRSGWTVGLRKLLGTIYFLRVPAAVLDLPDVHDGRIHITYFSLPDEDDVSEPVFRILIVAFGM